MKKLILLCTITILLGLSCAQNGDENEGKTSLAGIWKLKSSDSEYSGDVYRIIAADLGSYRDFIHGALQEITYLSDVTDYYSKCTKYLDARNTSLEGSTHSFSYEVVNDILSITHQADDGSWTWNGVFERVDVLPAMVFEEDFESTSAHETFNMDEWKIKDDGTGNSVAYPDSADENSDLHISLAGGTDFTIEYDFYRFNNGSGDCWSVIDLNQVGSFCDWIKMGQTNSLGVGTREAADIGTVAVSIPFETWQTIKIVVTNGKDLVISVNGTEVGTASYSEARVYETFKFEGNPTNGNWYLDNIKLTYQGVVE